MSTEAELDEPQVAATAERGAARVPVTPALTTTAAAAAAVVGLQAIPLALTGVAVSGLFLAVAIVLAPGGQAMITTVDSWWSDFVYWVRGLFS